jgi:hypothetical protein
MIKVNWLSFQWNVKFVLSDLFPVVNFKGNRPILLNFFKVLSMSAVLASYNIKYLGLRTYL